MPSNVLKFAIVLSSDGYAMLRDFMMVKINLGPFYRVVKDLSAWGLASGKVNFEYHYLDGIKYTCLFYFE